MKAVFQVGEKTIKVRQEKCIALKKVRQEKCKRKIGEQYGKRES